MNTDLHTLSGAYAIDALSREEAERFKTHLDACPSCAQEVRELQAAAARMGAIEGTAPPAYLKARVMQAADREPQLPPTVRHPGGVRSSTRPAWFPRLMVAAAVALLVAAAGIGYSQLRGENAPESQLASGVVRVFDAPDAHEATIPTANGGTVTVATSPSLNRMAVDTEGLPDLDEGQVYQLWEITDDAIASAGLLSDPDAGAAMPMPAEGAEVAISVEPAGGSEQPTTEPIMTVTASEV
ncbi:MAG TPA: anti-sigma factor [Nocardioidaceae bacterium]|nr:anti-sigma factor [Nocardioidaceae bacterium]